MSQCFRGSYSILGGFGDHLLAQVLRLGRYFTPQGFRVCHIALLVLVHQLFRFASKHGSSSQKGIKDDSNAKNVRFNPITMRAKNLRCDVAQRTTAQGELLVWIFLNLGESKVSYYDVSIVVFVGQNQIFRLQIAVYDLLRVQILERV